MITIHRSICIASLLILISGSAKAMDLSELDRLREERRQLEAEELSINRARQNSDSLSQRLGLIRHIQEKMLTGPNGALNLSSSWFANADTWLKTWDTLLSTTKSLGTGNAEELEANLQSGFNALAVSFDKLIVDGEEVRNLFQQSQAELQNLEPLPYGLTPDVKKQEYITALNTQQQKIIDFSVRMQKRFELTSATKLKEQMDLSRKLLERQLLDIRLQTVDSRLIKIIDEAKKKLAFVATFEGNFTTFNRQCKDVQNMFKASRVFEAQRRMKDLELEKDRIISEIEKQGIQGPIVANSKKSIMRAFEQAKKTEAEILNDSSERYEFLNFVDRQRRRLSEDCRDESLRPFRDCELLAILNRVQFNDDTLNSWKREDMEYFEGLLVKVRSSSSLGGQGK